MPDEPAGYAIQGLDPFAAMELLSRFWPVTTWALGLVLFVGLLVGWLLRSAAREGVRIYRQGQGKGDE